MENYAYPIAGNVRCYHLQSTDNVWLTVLLSLSRQHTPIDCSHIRFCSSPAASPQPEVSPLEPIVQQARSTASARQQRRLPTGPFLHQAGLVSCLPANPSPPSMDATPLLCLDNEAATSSLLAQPTPTMESLCAVPAKLAVLPSLLHSSAVRMSHVVVRMLVTRTVVYFQYLPSENHRIQYSACDFDLEWVVSLLIQLFKRNILFADLHDAAPF